jgi:hypothetical protein
LLRVANRDRDLRNDADSPHAVTFVSDMGPAGIDDAIAVVMPIPDVGIPRVVADNGRSPAPADQMIPRKADLATRVN